jgi:CBS domain-containing protein
MARKTIYELIEGRELARVAPDITVEQACHLLDRLNVGAAVVLEGQILVGVLSERNVIRRCICQFRRPDETFVSEIMTRNPPAIDIERDLGEAQSLMRDGRVQYLPVKEDNRVVGLLSMQDIPTDHRLRFEHFIAWQDRQKSTSRV